MVGGRSDRRSVQAVIEVWRASSKSMFDVGARLRASRHDGHRLRLSRYKLCKGPGGTYGSDA